MKFKQLNNPLIKNSFVYVVCDGINKAIPFLILPFLSYYLSTEDYGIVTNFGVLLNILIVFSSSTINLLLSKFYRLGITERKSFISNIVLLNILSIFAEAVICLPLNHIIENGLGLPLNFQVYCLIATLFSAITTINMAIWRCEEKPLYFGAFQISRSLVNAATAILLVIIFLLGWKGRVYGMVFTHVLFGILSCVILSKRGYFEFKFSKVYAIEILSFSLPLIPHGMSFWFRSGVSKILVTNMCDLSSNGLYSVALTWTAIVSLVLVAFSNAFSPYLFKELTLIDKNRDETLQKQIKIVRIIKWCMLLIILFVIVAYLVSCLCIRWIYAPAYWDSIRFLPLVMLGQMFDGFYSLFVCFAHYTGKTKPLGAITFTWGMLSIFFSWAFISIFGSIGVAVSTAFTSLMIFVSVFILATKVYQLPWSQLLFIRSTKK